MFPLAFRDATLEDYTYYGSDMNWFIFTSEKDYLFNPKEHLEKVNRVFDTMEEEKRPKILYSDTTEGVSHE